MNDTAHQAEYLEKMKELHALKDMNDYEEASDLRKFLREIIADQHFDFGDDLRTPYKNFQGIFNSWCVNFPIILLN